MAHALDHTRPTRFSMPSLRRLLSLAHQRSRLAKLDDAQLRDIGVSRADAMAEARRPIWDVPVHWLL